MSSWGFCGGSREPDDDRDCDRSEGFRLLPATFSGDRRRSLETFSSDLNPSTPRRPIGGDESTLRVTGGEELDRWRLRAGGVASFRRSLLRDGEGSGRRRLSLGGGDGE